MRRLKSIFIITLLAALTLQACNLPEGVDPNAPDFDLTVTANAAMIETALASGELPPEAQGVPGTEESALPLTEEVVIPAAVLPPAVGDVTVTVSVATNCRQGPGTAFANIYGMPVGQVAKVIAKNESSGYWIIEIPGQNGQSCWLWGRYATVTGDTSSLKVAAIPTSPATATATATKAATATTTATPTSTKSASSGAIAGCTDPAASNYNSAATVNDGSCTYIGPAIIGGCTDPKATNYNPNANADDGSCSYPVSKPNVPTIKSYSCGVTGPDGNGNYTYNYQFSWNDTSNNEDGFSAEGPDGTINYPANATKHVGSFAWPSATLQFDVRVSAFNSGGSATSAWAPLICP